MCVRVLLHLHNNGEESTGIMPALNLRTLELRGDEVLPKLTQLTGRTAVTKTGFPDPKLTVLSY